MKTLLSADEIAHGVLRLGGEVNAAYAGRPLTLVGILTGSVMLLADLMRQLAMPLQVGVIQARSYRGPATAPGELSLAEEFLPDIRGRDVLLVDDIFDTGQTLDRITRELAPRQPRSIAWLVLLRKAGRSRVAGSPQFVGFEIPDEFVVGYGLDYRDAYRNLPYVAALEPADLAAWPTGGTTP